MNVDKYIKKYQKVLKDLWTYFLRPLVIVGATFLILYIGVTTVVKFAAEKFILPPDPDNAEEFVLEIPNGYGVKSIAKLLEKEEIISNSFVFKLYVDVCNNSYKLKSGRYVFRHNMTMQEVMEQLLIGINAVPATNIVIPEGWTISRIATYLTETKQLTGFTAEEFIEYCVPENFPEYEFLQGIPEERADYGYVLQGYLFPDTYSIYINATPHEIIEKMLDNFVKRVTPEIIEKAETMGYTVDELITFASVLEKEGGNSKEFARCAAVFHNRVKKNMRWQSDATLIYALAIDGIYRDVWGVSEADTQYDSGYNTYKYLGLPIGPICNPGLAAIKAVVEPNQDDIKAGMLYFTLNPDTGTNTFNSDYNKHLYYSKLYADRYKELQNQQNKN
ncbi:MAG: endolytic transglycosylase MltG [Clostridiales bacterium]|nr:endolytic transglycosylase MltG [Clostridiales bacterium]